MSKYTTAKILDMIGANGGPDGLDLSGQDLSGINLGVHAIQAELVREAMHHREFDPAWRSHLTGGINLRRANLEGTDLRQANLEAAVLEWASLQTAILGAAKLQRAILGQANLQEAELWRADLRAADLRKANLKGANLWHGDFRGATLHRAVLRSADLRHAQLDQADLSRADLREANLIAADLTAADLSRVDLRLATLEKVDLEGAHFVGTNLVRVHLLDVKSLQGVRFYRAVLDHTTLTADQLGAAIGEELKGEWFEAKEAYLALKTNFEQIGRYDDASWAYRKERRMEKREAWHKAGYGLRERQWCSVIGNILKTASDQLVEVICDYGEGIWRVIGCLFVLWVVFAVSYGIIAGVWEPWQTTSTGRVRYATRSPADLFLFSIGVTTRMPPGLEARSITAMRILMSVQALLGTVLAGLLGFVLGNRIRRS